MSTASSGYEYSGTSSSAPNDPLTGYVMYPLQMKSHAERDEDERRILCQSNGFDLTAGSYESGNYLDAYWSIFHPTFPIIHRPTFHHEQPSPLLEAAVIAVGAQFSYHANSKTDSQNLHERCLKILSQRDLDVSLPQRSCDMQAAFLIELLSQYKGRRASQHLSVRFRDMYQFVSTQVSRS